MVGLEMQLKGLAIRGVHHSMGCPVCRLIIPACVEAGCSSYQRRHAKIKGKTEIRNLLPYATSSQRPHLLRDFSPAPRLLEQVLRR